MWKRASTTATPVGGNTPPQSNTPSFSKRSSQALFSSSSSASASSSRSNSYSNLNASHSPPVPGKSSSRVTTSIAPSAARGPAVPSTPVGISGGSGGGTNVNRSTGSGGTSSSSAAAAAAFQNDDDDEFSNTKHLKKRQVVASSGVIVPARELLEQAFEHRILDMQAPYKEVKQLKENEAKRFSKTNSGAADFEALLSNSNATVKITSTPDRLKHMEANENDVPSTLTGVPNTITAPPPPPKRRTKSTENQDDHQQQQQQRALNVNQPSSFLTSNTVAEGDPLPPAPILKPALKQRSSNLNMASSQLQQSQTSQQQQLRKSISPLPPPPLPSSVQSSLATRTTSPENVSSGAPRLFAGAVKGSSSSSSSSSPLPPPPLPSTLPTTRPTSITVPTGTEAPPVNPPQPEKLASTKPNDQQQQPYQIPSHIKSIFHSGVAAHGIHELLSIIGEVDPEIAQAVATTKKHQNRAQVRPAAAAAAFQNTSNIPMMVSTETQTVQHKHAIVAVSEFDVDVAEIERHQRQHEGVSVGTETKRLVTAEMGTITQERTLTDVAVETATSITASVGVATDKLNPPPFESHIIVSEFVSEIIASAAYHHHQKRNKQLKPSTDAFTQTVAAVVTAKIEEVHGHYYEDVSGRVIYNGPLDHFVGMEWKQAVEAVVQLKRVASAGSIASADAQNNPDSLDGNNNNPSPKRNAVTAPSSPTKLSSLVNTGTSSFSKPSIPVAGLIIPRTNDDQTHHHHQPQQQQCPACKPKTTSHSDSSSSQQLPKTTTDTSTSPIFPTVSINTTTTQAETQTSNSPTKTTVRHHKPTQITPPTSPTDVTTTVSVTTSPLSVNHDGESAALAVVGGGGGGGEWQRKAAELQARIKAVEEEKWAEITKREEAQDTLKALLGVVLTRWVKKAGGSSGKSR